MSTSLERRVDARFVLSVIACGIMSFSGVVVETAMNITFPALMAEFVVDTATVQLITTGYLLVRKAPQQRKPRLNQRSPYSCLSSYATRPAQMVYFTLP